MRVVRGGVDLDEPLRRGVVDAKTASALEKVGLHTVRDLLWYFPRRYLDLGVLTPLAELEPEEQVTFLGRVTKTAWVTTRNGTQLYKVTIFDGRTSHEVTFFNPKGLPR